MDGDAIIGTVAIRVIDPVNMIVELKRMFVLPECQGNGYGMSFEVTDITRQTYELLKAKREATIANQAEFEAEGYTDWFDMLIGQTDCTIESFEQFKEKMARYIYVIQK